MKIIDILKEREKGVSFEFFPPKNEVGKESLINTLEALKDFKPLYVSMTCGAGGATQKRTQEAVRLLLKTKDLVVMPHLTCIDINESGLKGILDEYKNCGVENIMALRGDPPQGEADFDFRKQKFFCARDLVRVINKENFFCIGVAVYPEGHIETSSLQEDLEYTKEKIAAGADFAVTQMFFDNVYYYKLLERMKKGNIGIPVLPGILPLTNLKKVRQFASICRATIPKTIQETMDRFSQSPEDQKKAGIEFTIKQCRDLIKNGANQLHFFTLNKPEIMRTILDALPI